MAPDSLTFSVIGEIADARGKAYHGDDLPSKNTDTGFEAQKDCILKHGGKLFPSVIDLVDDRHRNSCWHHRIRSDRIDDVLKDAILALTARDSTGTYPTLSAGADSTCDPLIVYPDI